MKSIIEDNNNIENEKEIQLTHSLDIEFSDSLEEGSKIEEEAVNNKVLLDEGGENLIPNDKNNNIIKMKVLTKSAFLIFIISLNLLFCPAIVRSGKPF